MIRNFIGIKLGHKQKFSFQPQNGLIAYIITGLALLGSQASLYCVEKNQHILIARLKGSKSNFKLKLQMSQDSIQNLYVISEDQSEIYVLGYEIKIQQQSNRDDVEINELVYKDEFRALQPREDRSIDSDEYNKMSKQEKKKYKKEQKLKQQQ